MPAIQILTRNNEETIQACIESLSQLDAEVVVGDLGSTDNTVAMCDEMGATTYHLGEMERHVARNKLARDDVNIAVEPWEILAQGNISDIATCSYASVMNQKVLTKEIRLWRKPLEFVNPTFETIDAITQTHSNLVFYAVGGRDYQYDRMMIARWKKNPLTNRPHYYQACIELAEGKIAEFMQAADYYLFLDRSNSMSAIMLRYYLAYSYLTQRKVRPTLQNINLCLCERPLMAEFWCLMADVYYHLIKDFRKAIEFYENAIVLGSRRKQNDVWPLDLNKYRQYPTRMIESCQTLMKSSI